MSDGNLSENSHEAPYAQELTGIISEARSLLESIREIARNAAASADTAETASNEARTQAQSSGTDLREALDKIDSKWTEFTKKIEAERSTLQQAKDNVDQFLSTAKNEEQELIRNVNSTVQAAQEQFGKFEEKLTLLEVDCGNSTRSHIVDADNLRSSAENLKTEAHALNAKNSELDNMLTERITNIDNELRVTKEALDNEITVQKTALLETSSQARSELETLLKDARDIKNQYEDQLNQAKISLGKYIELFNRKGLAHSFETAAKEQLVQSYLWSLIMIATIGTAVWCGIDSGVPTGWEDMLVKHSWYMIPLAWLAVYTSGQASRHKTIYQDYCYKGASGFAYEGFKNEVSGDTALQVQLLDKVIANFGTNPVNLVPHTEGESLLVKLIRAYKGTQQE